MSSPDETGTESGRDPAAVPGSGADPRATLVRDVALYTVTRLLLVVVVAAVLQGVSVLVGVAVPLVVTVLLALVLALPLSRLLLRSLRLRVDRGFAAFTASRSAERERLRARLRGDETPPPA